MIQTSAFLLAQRFVGTKEIAGVAANPQVLAMLQLTDPSVQDDSVPWCSGFVNYIAWLLRLPRSKSLAARSWLAVGTPINYADARPDCDVVILSRGAPPQPGPEVVNAQGHVGFYAGTQGSNVLILGGNQGDQVCIEQFPSFRVLGVRRLA